MSTKSNQQAMGLQVFYNEDENVTIRTEVIKNEPWFVAKDVASALDITWNGKTLAAIPEDWKGTRNLLTPSSGTRGGGEQQLVVINESAMYKLAFRSNKIQADVFVNWIAGEVLPSIRRTGSYSSTTVQPAIEQRAKLPLPKFRPFYKEWKANIAPYISWKEIDELAAELCVTPGHVRKVYQGTSMSRGIVDMLTATASLNRSNGVDYPPTKGVYEQMVILWDEDTNKNG